MKKKILVVDDEVHIVEFLQMNLRQNGYQPVAAYDGAEAIQIAKKEKPDCILLDLMLPSINGLETCRRLKQDVLTKDIPIIMLTAKSEETDKVIGLGVGADDYITKPFGLAELFARIEVVMRRYNDIILEINDERTINLKDLLIDCDSYVVEKKGVRIELTRNEFELLKLLAKQKNTVVTREEIINSLGLGNNHSEGRALDAHVRNLRKKLGDDITAKKYIETVRGVGFKCSD